MTRLVRLFIGIAWVIASVGCDSGVDQQPGQGPDRLRGPVRDFCPLAVGNHWEYHGTSYSWTHALGSLIPGLEIKRDIWIISKELIGDTIVYNGTIRDSSSYGLNQGAEIYTITEGVFILQEVNDSLLSPVVTYDQPTSPSSYSYHPNLLNALFLTHTYDSSEVSKTKIGEMNRFMFKDTSVIYLEPIRREAQVKISDIGLTHYYWNTQYYASDVWEIWDLLRFNDTAF